MRILLRLFLILLLPVVMLPGPGRADPVLLDTQLGQKWTGDFGEMEKRRQIRVLMPYSKTFYFLDRATQRGLTYELFQQFDKMINKNRGKKTRRLRVVIIPTSRDRLFPALVEGVGDIAAGNLTITPGREKIVDFSAPLLSGVSENVVTGKASPSIETLDDLAGKEIYVRRSSSYYESLEQLNARFREAGKPEIRIVAADENLEDEDLLEMLNAGLIPMTVIDSHKGAFWSQIFTDLTVHEKVELRTGGQIAWAFRRESPKLKEVVNGFVRSHKKGTRIGKILMQRYLKNTDWVRNSLEAKELERFEATVELFEKYSKQYGFDWLMIAALAYQESQIDQSKRSAQGAIGVMQLLPSTAADRNIQIRGIEKIENNVHAGVKYLRFLRDRYFETEPMDDVNKMLFTFASYNAGPNKVNRLRQEASQKGLDPNLWFQNVEIVAAQRVGREPVQYVGNIYKYYIAYRLIVERFHFLDKIKAQRAK